MIGEVTGRSGMRLSSKSRLKLQVALAPLRRVRFNLIAVAKLIGLLESVELVLLDARREP
jgi:hypothetical protein